MSQQINLLDDGLPTGVGLSASTRALLLGLLVVMVVLLAVCVATWHRTTRLEQQARQSAAAARATQAQIARDAPAAMQAARSDTRMRGNLAARRLLQSRIDRGDFGHTQGVSALLEVLARQAVDGLWITRFEVADGGRQLTISGRATRPDLVTDFIARLKREPLLAGKSFAALHVERPAADPATRLPTSNVVEFTLRGRPMAATP
jgi:Tfp pilus assembly protein PilN